MAKDNKNLNKKPKISPYWIYGIIIAVFLAIQIFSGGFGDSTGIKTTTTEFFNYLRNGEVDKVEIINNRIARVYLTKEAQELEVHKQSKPKSFLPSVSAIPNYKFEFGDLKLFQEGINLITSGEI